MFTSHYLLYLLVLCDEKCTIIAQLKPKCIIRMTQLHLDTKFYKKCDYVNAISINAEIHHKRLPN